jgi:hypothetical protein
MGEPFLALSSSPLAPPARARPAASTCGQETAEEFAVGFYVDAVFVLVLTVDVDSGCLRQFAYDFGATDEVDAIDIPVASQGSAGYVTQVCILASWRSKSPPCRKIRDKGRGTSRAKMREMLGQPREPTVSLKGEVHVGQDHSCCSFSHE